MMQFQLGRNVCSTFEQAISHEWLVTNGIGGFSSGTICDTNTRRYHGLLIAALNPPVERTLLVASLDVMVKYRNKLYPLFTHEYLDGTVDPQGYLQLESFHLEQGLPVWRYAFADVLLEKRILMKPGENTTYVNFHLLRASAELYLEIAPLCTYRDYHSHSHGEGNLNFQKICYGFQLGGFGANDNMRSYQVTCAGANFVVESAWYWNFKHRIESARGLDDSEDLFRPGRFIQHLSVGQQASVVLTTESDVTESFASLSHQINKQQSALLEKLSDDTPDRIVALALATDQFIVERSVGQNQSGESGGKTIIAGYPWFSDWGRDTMIALPGLTLTTKRFDIAASILRTFAVYVDKGMLPNRFPDNAEVPEYNTVDATLWYFHAIDQYVRYSGDTTLGAELYPVLVDIIDWHQRGTRYGIKVDEKDGLLSAGEEGVQLTWMDAKVGDWVVTPRRGKAVEINALWYNALCIMTDFATQFGNETEVKKYRQFAAQTKKGFQRFWNESRACLYDVIDVVDTDTEGEIGSDNKRYDNRLRPNQLLAVSLSYTPLNSTQQKSIVDICARELLTSHGLRSLAQGEAGYITQYQGNPLQRDGAYHQGTVWAWLMGSFVDAHYRVYQDTEKARSFLEPLIQHLSTDCVGSISEIFDAEPPFKARGCFAQAWSVSEVLRAWFDCET